jgi:hypothetical protein
MDPSASKIIALRRELAQAERELRERAEREATRLAKAERAARREVQTNCLQLERIRRRAKTRLEAIISENSERFPGELKVAEMALRDVQAWELWDSTVYTIMNFACMRDRLHFLRGGTEREAVMREVITRGGVYTERKYFQEILK